MKKVDKITISELSELTGVSPSSIRYYLNEGLLPSPLRKGKTKAYYNEEHIQKLKLIKNLQLKKQLSIKEIKNIIPNYSSENEAPLNDNRKDDIITAAIELFRKKGYDQVNVNDIVELAGISKSTYYLNYDSKESLFIDCAEKIFFEIDADFKKINKEEDILKRMLFRADFFINECKHLMDMLHIARGAIGFLLPEKKDKLDIIFSNLAAPVENDLIEGISKGLFYPMDTKIIAYMLTGAVEYTATYLEDKNKSETSKGIKQLSDLIFNGIIRKKS